MIKSPFLSVCVYLIPHNIDLYRNKG